MSEACCEVFALALDDQFGDPHLNYEKMKYVIGEGLCEVIIDYCPFCGTKLEV
jgi:hypothetical protein